MKTRSRYLCLILVVGLFLTGASPANWDDVERYRFFLGESIQSELVRLIDRADDSVTVGMYYVMPPETAGVNGVFKALERARERGVTVRVGLEKRENKPDWNREAMTHLKTHSIQARWWHDDTIQHQKAVVVDQKMIFVGSQNLSYSGLMGDNWETGAIVRSPEQAERLTEYLQDQR